MCECVISKPHLSSPDCLSARAWLCPSLRTAALGEGEDPGLLKRADELGLMLLGRGLREEAGLAHDGGCAQIAVGDPERHAGGTFLGLRGDGLGLLGSHLIQTLTLHKVDGGIRRA